MAPIFFGAGIAVIVLRTKLARSHQERFLRMFGEKGTSYSRNATPGYYAFTGSFFIFVGVVCAIGAFVP